MKKVQKITINKGEGRNPLPPPATRFNWDEAQAVLRSWAYDVSERSYLKCDVYVTFEDGSDYTCRYDMSWNGRNTNGESLQQQVEREMGC